MAQQAAPSFNNCQVDRAALEAAMEKKTAKQASLHSKQTIGAGLGRET